MSETCPQHAARVLLVDDDATGQMVVETILARRGIDVDICNNGLEALDLIKSGCYDLVLMDCQMPVIDGYTATRRLRQLEESMKLARLPVVAITADTLSGSFGRCIEAGMDDYLTKPLTDASLDTILKKWIKTKVTIKPAPQSSTTTSKTNESSASVDLVELHKLQTMMGPTFVKLIRTYLDNTPSLICELRSAVISCNPKQQYQAAHALKNSSGIISAIALHELVAALEAKGRQGIIAPMVAVSDLAEEFERVRQALVSFIGHIPESASS